MNVNIWMCTYMPANKDCLGKVAMVLVAMVLVVLVSVLLGCQQLLVLLLSLDLCLKFAFKFVLQVALSWSKG